MKFRVVEIFSSIEGEGKRAGQLATFIRLAGCNLRCSYCDTAYAREYAAGIELELADIQDQVSTGNVFVTLTGGEPLGAANVGELIDSLLEQGKEINIETNGSMDIANYVGRRNLFLTMDWKTPSSGCVASMRQENLALLGPDDVLKIVMAAEDAGYVKDFLQRNNIKAQIYLSPVFNLLAPSLLVEFAKELAQLPAVNVKNLHMQLQLHKYIWDPLARGV